MDNLLCDDLGRVITLTNDHDILPHTSTLKTHNTLITTLTDFLSTSLGPHGSDKIIQANELLVTNDGATILSHMELSAPVTHLIRELSQATDDETGDGTTSVVLLAGALLKCGVRLVERGIHPLRVVEGYERSVEIVLAYLDKISQNIEFKEVKELNELNDEEVNKKESNIKEGNHKECNNNISNTKEGNFNESNLKESNNNMSSDNINIDNSIEDYRKNLYLSNISHPTINTNILLKAARTSLTSKITNNYLTLFAHITVLATLHTSHIDDIHILSRIGTNIDQTSLYNGTILTKEVSHPSMPRKATGRIAVLACPFEIPKVKTKHSLNIRTVSGYENLSAYEQSSFEDMIRVLKDLEVDVVFSQWGFDDEANAMLAEAGILAVRWVGGEEIERVAMMVGARIVSRFVDLESGDLGSGSVMEVCMGSGCEKIILVQPISKDGNENSNEKGEENKEENRVIRNRSTCTIYVRGGTEMVIEEVKRSLRDALCAVRNLITDKKIVYGGGSSEIACALHLQQIAKNLSKENGRTEYSAEDYECMLAFARGLEEIPFCLSRNSGHNAVNCVSELRMRQIREKNWRIGVDLESEHGVCMESKGVFDSLGGKKKQIRMAVQMVNTVLKIDDVIVGKE